MAHTNHNPRQRGFTLVEIAIVLVIVGLVLGGVLKGQEMIRGAKVKNVNNDAQNIISAVTTYKDRYGAMPGDDSISTIAVAAGVAGNGNGRLQDGENGAFWAHLRQAGLMKGTGSLPPSHSFGGLVEVDENPHANAQAILSALPICRGMSRILSIVSLTMVSRTKEPYKVAMTRRM